MSAKKTKLRGNQIDYRFFTIDHATKEQLEHYKCGNDYIDDFMKNKAKEDDEAVSYYWENKKTGEIIATASICCTGLIVRSGDVFNVYHAVEIRYFGVDESYQDIQYDEDIRSGILSDYILLSLEYEIINEVKKMCGFQFIVLYSTPDAEKFYEQNGYVDFVSSLVKSADIRNQGCIPKFKILDPI